MFGEWLGGNAETDNRKDQNGVFLQHARSQQHQLAHLSGEQLRRARSMTRSSSEAFGNPNIQKVSNLKQVQRSPGPQKTLPECRSGGNASPFPSSPQSSRPSSPQNPRRVPSFTSNSSRRGGMSTSPHRNWHSQEEVSDPQKEVAYIYTRTQSVDNRSIGSGRSLSKIKIIRQNSNSLKRSKSRDEWADELTRSPMKSQSPRSNSWGNNSPRPGIIKRDDPMTKLSIDDKMMSVMSDISVEFSDDESEMIDPKRKSDCFCAGSKMRCFFKYSCLIYLVFGLTLGAYYVKTSQSREIQIKNVLLKFVENPVLRDATTPQGRAFEWILHTDVAQLEALNPQLVERYVIAVLYFAFSGIGWISSEQWLSKKPICNWQGITCTATVDSTHVTRIQLVNNELRGTIPDEIDQLLYLEELALHENKIYGSIPQTLSGIENIKIIELYDNALTGQIPDSLFKWTPLTVLYLHWNSLTGTIPHNIGSAKKLQSLSLSGNKFQGNIPPSIGFLFKLEELWIWDCNISGTIPEDITALEQLRILELGSNNIVGTIPSNIGLLTNLEQLNIDQNGLTGSIPPSIGEILTLQTLLLGGNKFTGEIDSSICDLRKMFLEDLRANCANRSLPRVECACCTQCV
eukprot:CAMPEP_0194293298 /NCGR_PEP_ID=MMETSP0169-20130528/47621_1 /TAXON_ID=218684 /ORGANISM="Corethron pennatum, Strain L29A3" /LENGTH=628 /DNA_ID=CAMNT_0039041759 /DNA_START=107 /DNA_END=1993 /DNA_ORIENTATION=-